MQSHLSAKSKPSKNTSRSKNKRTFLKAKKNQKKETVFRRLFVLVVFGIRFAFVFRGVAVLQGVAG